MTTHLAMPPLRDAQQAAYIAAMLLGVAVAAALPAWALGADAVRGWLGFGFQGIDGSPGEALSIFFNNVRMLAALMLCCFVAQFTRERTTGFVDWLIARAVDGVVIGVATAHALMVGVSAGAYGGRAIGALFPHGPVELAAFSLALALYLSARRERILFRRWQNVGVACVLLLAVGAILEGLVAL